MSIALGQVEFNRWSYDQDADVLYLNVEGARPVHWEETREGHAVRFDADGRVCGLTLIGVRHHMESEGDVTVTLPHAEHIGADDLKPALA